MQKLAHLLSFICGLYILTVIVDWDNLRFFDYSIIVIYILCAVLSVINLFLINQKDKY